MRIHPKERTLLHAGVGNVETRFYPDTPSGLAGKLGVVGANPPTPPRIQEVPWPAGGMLISFTDGIRRRWSLEKMPDLLRRPVTMVGQLLLRAYGKDHDDATVVVVREGLQLTPPRPSLRLWKPSSRRPTGASPSLPTNSHRPRKSLNT